MTHVTRRLTARNRDQLRNPTLGNRIRATFTFFTNRESVEDKVICLVRPFVHFVFTLAYEPTMTFEFGFCVFLTTGRQSLIFKVKVTVVVSITKVEQSVAFIVKHQSDLDP